MLIANQKVQIFCPISPTEQDNGRLQQEIEKRLLIEKTSQKEIDRLRRELERLRNQAPKTVIVKEVYTLIRWIMVN
jgi:hypothetical protein